MLPLKLEHVASIDEHEVVEDAKTSSLLRHSQLLSSVHLLFDPHMSCVTQQTIGPHVNGGRVLQLCHEQRSGEACSGKAAAT